MATSTKRDNTINWVTDLGRYSKQFAAAVLERFDEHQEYLKETRLADRIKRSVRMYYSLGEDGSWDETRVNSRGDKGEFVDLAPATYRRIIQDRVALVMQTPPDFEPLALNTDSESQAQCSLAIGILDHYKREKNLEGIGVDRFEMSSVMAGSYTHVRWDYEAGERDRIDPAKSKFEKDPETGKDRVVEPAWIYKGDFVISLRSVFDVAYDRTSPDMRRPRWWIVCEPENRFDVLKQVENEGKDEQERAAIRKAVLGAPAWSDRVKELELDIEDYRFDDTIPVYYVYAEPSPSCPNGRKARVLNGDWVLQDSDLDEDRAGVFPLWPSRMMTRNQPYTNHFGGMPVARGVGYQLSTIASNHKSFGLQRLLTPREGKCIPVQLDSGLGRIDYDAIDGSGVAIPPPSVMQGLQSPPELFTLLDVLMKLQDTVQGGSPVHRGDPEATKGDSGSKAAMLYAAAQQIAAGDVRAKHESDAEIASFIISSIKRHADVPRIVTIVGKNNSYSAKQFTKDDLDQITRVHVRQANPARDTFAGRVQLAEMLMAAKTPEEREQIQALILTGRIESVTEDIEAGRILIERENDVLLDPNQPPPAVLPWDDHARHIKEHGELLKNPDVRSNPILYQRVDAQMRAHIDALNPASPRFAGNEILLVTGQRPLPVPGMMGPPGGTQAPANGNGGGPVQATPKSLPMARGPANDNGEQRDRAMPREPGMPRNPATGEPVKMPGAGPGAPVVG